MPDSIIDDASEECEGCGWAFTDGGGVHYSPPGPGHTGPMFLCTPCYHLPAFEGPGAAATLQDMAIVTNLILKAIRDRNPTPSHQSETALKTPVEGEEG